MDETETEENANKGMLLDMKGGGEFVCPKCLID